MPYTIQQFADIIYTGTTRIPAENLVLINGPLKVTINSTCTFCYEFDAVAQTLTAIDCELYNGITTTTTTLAVTTTTTTIAPETTTTTTISCPSVSIEYYQDRDSNTISFVLSTTEYSVIQIFDNMDMPITEDRYTVTIDGSNTIIEGIFTIDPIGRWKIMLDECLYQVNVDEYLTTTTTFRE